MLPCILKALQTTYEPDLTNTPRVSIPSTAFAGPVDPDPIPTPAPAAAPVKIEPALLRSSTDKVAGTKRGLEDAEEPSAKRARPSPDTDDVRDLSNPDLGDGDHLGKGFKEKTSSKIPPLDDSVLDGVKSQWKQKFDGDCAPGKTAPSPISVTSSSPAPPSPPAKASLDKASSPPKPSPRKPVQTVPAARGRGRGRDRGRISPSDRHWSPPPRERKFEPLRLTPRGYQRMSLDEVVEEARYRKVTVPLDHCRNQRMLVKLLVKDDDRHFAAALLSRSTSSSSRASSSPGGSFPSSRGRPSYSTTSPPPRRAREQVSSSPPPPKAEKSQLAQVIESPDDLVARILASRTGPPVKKVNPPNHLGAKPIGVSKPAVGGLRRSTTNTANAASKKKTSRSGSDSSSSNGSSKGAMKTKPQKKKSSENDEGSKWTYTDDDDDFIVDDDYKPKARTGKKKMAQYIKH